MEEWRNGGMDGWMAGWLEGIIIQSSNHPTIQMIC